MSSRLGGASSTVIGLPLSYAEPHEPVADDNAAAALDSTHSKTAQQVALKPDQQSAGSLKHPARIGTSLAGAASQTTKMAGQNRATKATNFNGKQVWMPEMAAGGNTAFTSVADTVSGDHLGNVMASQHWCWRTI